MSTSPKELVRALFAGKPVSRPPFIPYMATAAAQFMQVPIQQMFSDPATLANSLQACQRLFKYDGIVIPYDTTLEAEACGCQLSWQENQPPKVVSPISNGADNPETLNVTAIENKGRIPVVLEAAKRLTQTVGKDVAILGTITGPITLGRHLIGDAFIAKADTNLEVFENLLDLWKRIALILAGAYGELKLDAVILVDKDLAYLEPNHYSKIQPTLKTLCNLVRFYDAPVIIHIERVSAENLQHLLQLEADGFSLGNPISHMAYTPSLAGMLLGGCLPSSVLLGSAEDIQAAMLELVSGSSTLRLFITSESEVPRETPATNLHKVMQILKTTSV